MNLLICNIGSSDLDRDALSELRGLGERERAARILADYQAYRERLDLPIIGKALRYVQNRSGKLLQIVLIASDQGSTPPDDPQTREDWGKDTLLTAEVVARCLGEPGRSWEPVPRERIAIWTIAGEDRAGRDPADYDGVRRFLERELPRLRQGFPGATAYLEVTGGTPAMTTGLLVAGTEVFSTQAVALYIHPRRPLPATLSTGKRLLAGPLRAALRSYVATYNYDAALRLFHEQREAIVDRLEPGAAELLEALLDYARHRFNFDFCGARETLEGGIDQAGEGRWRDVVMGLYQEVHQPTRFSLLAEVYYGAEARYKVGAYADFLAQAVRLQENALRHLCLERGARFVDRSGSENPNGMRLHPDWASARGLDGWRDQEIGRARMPGLLQHLATQRGENVADMLNMLKRLNGLADLRNNAIHTLQGVRKRDLAERFAGQGAAEERADDILPHLAAICALISGGAPGPSPFARINTLIDSLLREANR